MGVLSYFADFLKLTGVFENFVEQCPLVYLSNNAPAKRDVLGTIKPIYGKQEGAVLGYNPSNPGRPSHAYHSFWVGHLRLCLSVQVLEENSIFYEYAVYVTNLEYPAKQIRSLYNPRGDNENCYGEMKNHWGWKGTFAACFKRMKTPLRSIKTNGHASVEATAYSLNSSF